MTNKLDQIYRSLRLTKYFIKGWGKPENLKRICEFRKMVSNRKTCFNLVPSDYPVVIEKEHEEKDTLILDGYFISPFVNYLPEVVPEACHKAYFQFILPKKWHDDKFKPVIIHIAGTGDQFFWRRRQFVAKPLLKEAQIASIILENPFYGLRKPEEQTRSILHNVSDIFVMGGCLMLESVVLFHYCERMGFGPLGITGLSMGGHMACISATPWPKPLVIVPCLAGMTASYVFTQGVISQALNWKMLQEEYLSEAGLKNEVQKMVKIIEGDAFRAGQQFAKNMVKATEFANESPSKLCTLDDNIPNNNLSNEPDLSSAIVCDSDKSRNSSEDHRDFNSVSDDVQNLRKSTVNSLLNLIVRLARASVNLNILSSDAEDKLIKLNNNKINHNEQEAVNFMHGIMDECTHLKNYPVPVDTSLAIAVCADDDAYIPLKARSNFGAVWPGTEVRYVKGGHVRAYVQYQKEFRTAIIDGFQRYRYKYIDNCETKSKLSSSISTPLE